MSKTENYLLAKVTQSPLFLSPDSENVFLESINYLAESEIYADMNEVDKMSTMANHDDDFWAEDTWQANYRPYEVSDGVLQIPVTGVLLNNNTFTFGSYMTGYQYIERALERGMADSEVNAIALVIDSGGGMVAGNFELVEKIAEYSSEKPINAFVTDYACSAAYNIAAASNVVTAARGATLGSVGVLITHIEYSEYLKTEGIKYTLIHAGKYKVDGNHYEKLSDTARARYQAEIDTSYDEFTALVAENRAMSQQAVKETEALTYKAQDAVDVGFADAVGAIDKELAIFAKEAEPRNKYMAKNQGAPAVANNDSPFTQADVDAARAEGQAEATKDAATAERSRINTITGTDTAKARPVAAQNVAMNTDMDADAAEAFLKGCPEEAAQTPAEAPAAAETPTPAAPAAAAPAGNTFAAAMDEGNEPVGAAPAAPEADAATETSNSLLDSLAAARNEKRVSV